MDLSNTFVISTVINLIQAFWSEPVGRIFLITAITYSISYMLYSSYISWFAGGYGSVLLGQIGFTAADFLSLAPTSFMLIYVSILRFTKFFVKYAFIYIALPLLIGYTIVTIRSAKGLLIANQSTLPATIGFLIYFAGLGLSSGLLESIKNRANISMIVCWSGSVLVGLTLSPATVGQPPDIDPNLPSLLATFINELTALLLLFYLTLAPSLVGLKLASHAAKEELLSQVKSLTLKEFINIDGLSARKTREKESASFSYKPKRGKPIYLISTFSRVTAIYIPPQAIEGEYGRMCLLANEIVCSIEVEGRKNEINS